MVDIIRVCKRRIRENIFISKERRTIIGEKKIEGARDLVVKIFSPAIAYYICGIKCAYLMKHQ